MTAFICVVLTFALVVVLLRLNLRVGRALALGVLFLMATLGVSPGEAAGQVVENWRAAPSLAKTFILSTADILLLVTMVNVLGYVMSACDISGRMPDALVSLLRSRRTALSGIPAIMGLMPTPGGIMLSAPLVRDTARRFGVAPWRAALVNYWFRHQWEYSFPLYPAFPIVFAILSNPEHGGEVTRIDLMLHNGYLTVVSLVIGAVFLLRGIPKTGGHTKPSWRTSGHPAIDILWGIGPVAVALLLYTLAGLTVGVSVTVSVALLALVQRVPTALCLRMFRRAVKGDFLLAVFMAMFFGQVLAAAGAVESIGTFIVSTGMPPTAVLFILPFVVGATTGITSATLGMTFPLLVGFVIGDNGEVWYGGVALAFCGGLMGIFLSPVHICLTLTRSYFGVPFSRLHRHLIPMAALVTAIAVGVALWSG